SCMPSSTTSTLSRTTPPPSSTSPAPGNKLKSILLFTGAQCSFFIGAGIATGQESLQYFTAHGWWGMAAIVIVLLLFSWLLSSLTEWGRNHRNDTREPFTDICGKTLGTVVRFCVPVFVFMSAVTKFAGAEALLGDVFGLPIWVGATGMAVVVAITLMFGFHNLAEIIARIGPLFWAITAVVEFWGLLENFPRPAVPAENLSRSQAAKATGTWS